VIGRHRLAIVVSAGVVREFHPADGWGVIDGDDVPGGCWVSFAVIRMDGYRELAPSAPVRFTFERADQDGYAYRATDVWPSDQPSGGEDPPSHGTSTSTAYRSTLRLDDNPR
jgi:CspA family cold shock protein